MKIFNWFFRNKFDDKKEVEINVDMLKNNKVELNSDSEQFEIDGIDNIQNALCPYCKTELKKVPIRKSKCPNCKNYIFIRRLKDSNVNALLTEVQAQEVDNEIENEYLKNKGFYEVESFGVSKEKFLKRKEEHFLKYGIKDNSNDVVWSLFNELLIKNANDNTLLSRIYYSMAVFIYKEGKDNFKYLQLSAKATLDSFQLKCESSDLVFNIQIIVSRDSCDNCKSMAEKIMTIEEAYLLPVPCRDCTHTIGFCRCTYGVIPVRDSDGKLILKS